MTLDNVFLALHNCHIESSTQFVVAVTTHWVMTIPTYIYTFPLSSHYILVCYKSPTEEAETDSDWVVPSKWDSKLWYGKQNPGPLDFKAHVLKHHGRMLWVNVCWTELYRWTKKKYIKLFSWNMFGLQFSNGARYL